MLSSSSPHLKNLHGEYRTKEIFDIIIEHPESNGALLDLKVNLLALGQSGRLIEESILGLSAARGSKGSLGQIIEDGVRLDIPAFTISHGTQESETSASPRRGHQAHSNPICCYYQMSPSH
jgi:hypothetical protein